MKLGLLGDGTLEWSQMEQKQIESELDDGLMGEYLPSRTIQHKTYKLDKIYLASKGFGSPTIPL